MTDPGAVNASFLGTYRRLLTYLRPHRWVAVVAVLGMVFDAGSTSVFMHLIKPMLNDLFIARDPVTIFWLPIAIVILFFVRGASTYATDFGIARIGRGVVQQLRSQVFARYLRLPAAYFDRESSGQQISRLVYTVEQVANASTDALKTLILHSLTVLGLTLNMLLTSVRLTLALFVLAPVVAAIVFFVGRRYRRISHRIQRSMGSVTGIVDEVVSGQREVKIYGGQTYEATRFDAVADENRRLNLKVASTNALSTSLVQLVAACSLAAVIFVATRPGIIAHMDPGSFMSVITSMMVMLTSLKQLTTVQAGMQRGIAAAADLFSIVDTPGERDTGTVRVERCRGDLELRGVELHYPGQTRAALNGIDLRCASGTVTALVGPSGGGKSSLVSTIPRFYEPTAGEIRLDGRPLDDYTIESLREQIAWVGQKVVLFNDTVARNIAYGALAGASRAEIEDAARAANAMEFIAKLPKGLDSEVGEGGALLSGGQRQRIAIARALLKNAPILILDEATSALDSESERLIQNALGRLMRDRTVLVIAHRLSTIEHADQIVVLDDGRVVEQGTHATLLARNGKYAALHRMQFREDVAPVVPAAV
ncbi:MAG TPA: lipid A export permease/ATP-binding protein MsbA [Rhodanobacteraceae bacterium]|nr:lipid A export permease/ATP-binding protein MsbA [Rhodanobacteraceae bacterium]